MKNELTRKLKALGFLGLTTLAGCSTITPKGSMEVAYVSGGNDAEVKSQVVTEIDFGLEGEMDGLKTRIGGRHRAYIDLRDKSIWYDTDEYDFYVKTGLKNFWMYLTHTFLSLTGDKPFIVYDGNSERIYLNVGGRTKVGLRAEF